MDDDIKTCPECNGNYFVSEVHSCVGYLSLLMQEIVGKTAYDNAKIRLRNDQVYEASKTNLEASHLTDAGSKLDAMLQKFKIRTGTFEKLVFEDIAKFKD